MTNIKAAAPQVFDLVKKVEHAKEVFKELASQVSGVEEIDNQIKELQEQRKALISADVDCFAAEQEIKELSKELKQAAKFAAQGTSIKPATVSAFFKAKAEDEKKKEAKETKVGVVKKKGNDFAFLDQTV